MEQKKKQTSSWLKITFYAILAVFLLFNLLTLKNYGMTWDEPVQERVGIVARDYLEGKGSRTGYLVDNLTYYGPAFELANSYFSEGMRKILPVSYVDSNHILIVLVSVAGLLFLFWLVRAMFDEQIALYSSVFLMFFPRFVAHAHYNTKDIPLFVATIVVIYFLYIGFLQRKLWRILLAGVIFGFALATRIDAIIILPIFFLAYLIYLFFDKKIIYAQDRVKFLIKDSGFVLAFIGVSLAGMYVFWPWLWHNPMLAFESFKYFLHHSWDHQVLYLGQLYYAGDLPWHYAPLYLLLTTPVIILILFAFGIYAIFLKIKKSGHIFEFSLLFFWIAVRLGIALMPHAVRYDGIRHFLSVLPPISIVASLGLVFLLDYFYKRQGIRLLLHLVIFGWLLLEFFIVFPFGDSYFNEPARMILGPHIENKLEIEYWGATYRQGFNWLNANAPRGASICVLLADELQKFYAQRSDLSFECKDVPNYLMFMTRRTFYPPDSEQFLANLPPPVYTISRYGSDLLYIYQLK